jgi:predicted RNA-binding Zn-ribbon protein involved in translation (DUF1610 family)
MVRINDRPEEIAQSMCPDCGSQIVLFGELMRDGAFVSVDCYCECGFAGRQWYKPNGITREEE